MFLICTACSDVYQLNILLLCTQTWLSAVGGKKRLFRLKEVVAGEEIYVNHVYWKKDNKKCFLFIFVLI